MSYDDLVGKRIRYLNGQDAIVNKIGTIVSIENGRILLVFVEGFPPPNGPYWRTNAESVGRHFIILNKNDTTYKKLSNV